MLEIADKHCAQITKNSGVADKVARPKYMFDAERDGTWWMAIGTGAIGARVIEGPPSPRTHRGGIQDDHKEKIMSTPTADDSTAPHTSLGPFSSPGASPTPWEATEWALRRIQKFHLCTVRRDGRPHVTPLLAIWALGAMWFTTGDNEQKAKNLSANQHCALTTGTDTLTGMDYVIEGTASLVADQATREAVATAFEQAYGWQLTREDGTWYQLGDAVRTGKVQLYRVQPGKGFAFATGSESSQTRYRWR